MHTLDTYHARLAAFITLVVMAGSGCATSLSYNAFPRTLEPGEVHASLSGQLTLNSTVLTKGKSAIDIAEYHTRNPDAGPLTEAEYRELLDTVLAYALFGPSVLPEVGLRVGVVNGLDIGLRRSAGMTKGDLKLRLWESDTRDQALGLTAAVGYAGSLGSTEVKYITWHEFSRLDAEISVIYGQEYSTFLRVYGGPRLIYSWLTVKPLITEELEAKIPEDLQDYRPDQYFQDENILYLGATTGVMLGYRWIWLRLEMTLMYTLFDPLILKQQRDLSGITVAPVAGINVEF